MSPKTIIIVPCYNEEDRLDTEAFISFSDTVPQIHFLFANDGSKDGTARVIDSLASRSPEHFSALHLLKNSGKAEAVRQGFLKAFGQNPEFIGYFDADLATPLSAIPELQYLITARSADIAMGSRVQLLGRRIERSFTRHLAGRLFATAASLVLGLSVYDTQCGAKLFRATDRLRLVFAQPFSVTWIFDVEILARFILSEKTGERRLKDICIEHPLHEWEDKEGSKIRLKDFALSCLDLVKIWRSLHGRTRPH